MTKEPSASNATRWTLIVRAQGAGAETRAALGELIGHYEKLVVWLIRRHGHPPDVSAEELKQEFLEGVLRRNDIAKLDRGRGSFRGWLNLAVQRFLLNEWDKWRAAKAGRKDSAPLVAEEVDTPVPADDGFTREFAKIVILRTLERLRREVRNERRFDALVRFLPGPQMDLTELAPIARELSMTQTALAKQICLWRDRFRQLLRESIGDSLDVDSAATAAPAIDDELRDLRRHFWS
jgi:DNA-directed RNA polymerase specialized sigma24 family protein